MSNIITPPEYTMPNGYRFLDGPTDFTFVNHDDGDITEEEGLTMIPVIDVEGSNDKVRYNKVSMLKVSHIRYYPRAPIDYSSRNNTSDNNKGNQVERIVWFVDVCGTRGRNMVAILIYRNNKGNNIYDHDISLRDNPITGK